MRISEDFVLFVKHLILPAITLSVIYIALIARVTRASVLEALGEDYIRTARAKGLPEMRVLVRHALANAAVPIVTVIGIGIAILIGGVVVTESVYAIPGLGRLTVDAVLARDFPTIQGVILFFSFVYVLVNLAGRPVVRVPRPAHPLLMVLNNWSVRIGGAALALLLALAIAAPWLGTVDPTLFDAASRDLRPGEAGEITTLDGETREARVPHGLGLLRPRHLQPRALRHSRLAQRRARRRAGRARLRHPRRPRRRLPALARRAADARHGRRDGDSRRC